MRDLIIMFVHVITTVLRVGRLARRSPHRDRRIRSHQTSIVDPQSFAPACPEPADSGSPNRWLDSLPLVRGADPLLFGNPRGYRDQELAGGVAQMYAPEAVSIGGVVLHRSTGTRHAGIAPGGLPSPSAADRRPVRPAQSEPVRRAAVPGDH